MSRTISVQVRGDREVEPNETFHVELTSAQNALIVDGSGLATILNDDQGPRPFTVTQANDRKEKS